MPVATLLTIAATFWSQHGYQEARPVTWSWGIPAYVRAEPGYLVEAYAVFGSYQVSIDRRWWDRAPSWRKCEVLVHEVGHAAFRFDHLDGTVMSEVDDVSSGIRTVPESANSGR